MPIWTPCGHLGLASDVLADSTRCFCQAVKQQPLTRPSFLWNIFLAKTWLLLESLGNSKGCPLVQQHFRTRWCVSYFPCMVPDDWRKGRRSDFVLILEGIQCVVSGKPGNKWLHGGRRVQLGVSPYIMAKQEAENRQEVRVEYRTSRSTLQWCSTL